MSHYPPSKLTSPQPPSWSAGPCCVWCGQPLPENCPDVDFGGDFCQAAWMAWKNQVDPIPVPVTQQATPYGGMWMWGRAA